MTEESPSQYQRDPEVPPARVGHYGKTKQPHLPPVRDPRFFSVGSSEGAPGAGPSYDDLIEDATADTSGMATHESA